MHRITNLTCLLTDPKGTRHHHHPGVVPVHVSIQNVFPWRLIRLQRHPSVIWSFLGLGDT